MPSREAWRTLEGADAAAREYFRAEHWAFVRQLYSGILDARDDSGRAAWLVRLSHLGFQLHSALDVITEKVRALTSELAALNTDPPEADDLRRLLPSAKAISAGASRLSADLSLAIHALHPAFERVGDAYEATGLVKIGATGRSALLRFALEDPEMSRKARAWAFAAIALRIDPKCRDSDEFRERVGTWRREIRRIAGTPRS